MRALGILARLLPVLLALMLPYLTPGIRDQGPSIGAGWLQDNPARWGDATVSVLAFLPESAPLPEKDSKLITTQLQTHRRTPSDRTLMILAKMSMDGTSLLVEDAFLAKDPTRGRFTVQLGIGLTLLLLLPYGCLCRDEKGGWKLRPWIR